jgi:hypothetical protein
MGFISFIEEADLLCGLISRLATSEPSPGMATECRGYAMFCLIAHKTTTSHYGKRMPRLQMIRC